MSTEEIENKVRRLLCKKDFTVYNPDVDGTEGILYVDTNNGAIYIWDGTEYITADIIANSEERICLNTGAPFLVADPNNPTIAEVDAWAIANLTIQQRENGTKLVYFVTGSCDEPDYIWTLNGGEITLSTKPFLDAPVQSVANYTALRSLSNYDHNVVVVSDYNYIDLAGDSHTVLGGVFKKSSTTMSDDNGTVIIASDLTKWQRVFDLNGGINTDWFAIENHTTRFNHAANVSLLYNTHQYINGKTYKFSTILSDDGNYIFKPKTSVSGEISTLLKYENVAQQVALILIKDIENTIVENLSIELTNVVGNVCINIQNSDNTTIQNVILSGSWWSCFTSLSSYCTYRNITAKSNGGGHNIELNETTNCIIENCNLESSLGVITPPGNNIEIYSKVAKKSNNNIIRNNTLTKSNSGVGLFGAENTIIEGNYIDSTRSCGIILTNWEFADLGGESKYTIVKNNYISSSGNTDLKAQGIFDAGLYNIIEGNTVTNCGLFQKGEAILIYGEYSTVSKNTIYNNYGVGILINTADYANVESNILYNNSITSVDRNSITVESCTNAKISNNTMFCTGTPTTLYGLFINSNATNTIARDNISYNHASWNIYNSSTTSKITSIITNSFGQLGGNNTITSQFTATAGQTSFSTSGAGSNLYYMTPTSNPDVDVFVNGALLQYINSAPGAGQYTYGNNTVTTYALTAGDKVTIKFRR